MSESYKTYRIRTLEETFNAELKRREEERRFKIRMEEEEKVRRVFNAGGIPVPAKKLSIPPSKDVHYGVKPAYDDPRMTQPVGIPVWEELGTGERETIGDRIREALVMMGSLPPGDPGDARIGLYRTPAGGVVGASFNRLALKYLRDCAIVDTSLTIPIPSTGLGFGPPRRAPRPPEPMIDPEPGGVIYRNWEEMES